MGWEWRCFYRVASATADDFVHEALRNSKLEQRTDQYVAHSAAVGVKHRGGGSLEVKLRKKTDQDFEKWKKHRCNGVLTAVDQLLERTGHAALPASSSSLQVAKCRRQAFVGGGALLEQTELLVGAGVQASVWRTVAVEGKRADAAQVRESILPLCRAQAAEDSFSVQGYPAFVVRLVRDEASRAGGERTGALGTDDLGGPAFLDACPGSGVDPQMREPIALPLGLASTSAAAPSPSRRL
eukprot:6711018-Prymnesium_polylepis.1